MKCLNIAESIMKYGLPFQISHLLWQQQADATGKNMSKVCEATLHDLADFVRRQYLCGQRKWLICFSVERQKISSR